MAWRLFTDAACTNVFSGVLSLVHYSDFSDNPQDTVLYYAETQLDPADNGSYKMVRSDGSNITISVADNDVGSGHEATEVKLATTSAGLDTAVAGASLSLGTELVSGASNAQEIHVRVTNAVTTPGVSQELTLDKNETVVLSNV